jgi:hypothetical protein
MKYDNTREDKLSHITRNIMVPAGRIDWFHHAPAGEMVLTVTCDEVGFSEEHRIPCDELDAMTGAEVEALVAAKVPAQFRK